MPRRVKVVCQADATRARLMVMFMSAHVL